MRHTLAVLTALCLSASLAACGLKGPLYLAPPDAATAPASNKKATKPAATEANKGGDDNKASSNKYPTETKQ